MKQTKNDDRKLHLDTTRLRVLTPEQLVTAPGGLYTITAATCVSTCRRC